MEHFGSLSNCSSDSGGVQPSDYATVGLVTLGG